LNIKEYISSGILELYVANQLSVQERAEVEAMMQTHAEVRQEVYEIENAIEKYSQISSVNPPAELRSKILNALPPKENKVEPASENKLKWNILHTLLLSLAGLGFTLYFTNKINHTEELQKINKQIEECDSIKTSQLSQYAFLNDIKDRNNRIIAVSPTPKYKETKMYFHYNPVTKKNYIQIDKLPSLEPGQAYQLWSLKPNANPIPMDVFTSKDLFAKVNFEDGTQTYAVTIESEKGASTPALDRLIGTFTL
jgi:anti-sigma-K factor RskA